jgi:hypothetical protein
VDFARTNLKRSGFQRDNRAEPFGYVPDVEKKGGFAHVKTARRSVFSILIAARGEIPRDDETPRTEITM